MRIEKSEAANQRYQTPINWCLALFFILTTAIFLLSSNQAHAAISYISSTSNPADGNSLGTATVAITPVAGTTAGDLIILVANSRDTSATLAISQAGGQTWTAETAASTTNTNATSRIFWARFNGTWSASPSVSFSGNHTATTVSMHVFQPTLSSNTWAIDVAQNNGSFTNTSSDVTIAGITTQTSGALVFATWASSDNNQWSIQTSNWSSAGSNQYANTDGSDSSQASLYKILPTAGATNNVTNRMTSAGTDAGVAAILAFKEVSAGACSTSELVSNGSFELPALKSGENWATYSSIPNWSISNSNFEIQKAGSVSGFNTSYVGPQYLELNGDGLGTITQTIATTAGRTYNLKFGYSGRSDTPGGQASSVDVYWGSVKQGSFTAAANSGWISESISGLSASGASTALKFVSTGPSNSTFGSYIDGISVIESCSTLDHVRLNHTGSGVTCTGSSVTVNACNSTDSGGVCAANTAGLTGNVIARSSGGVVLATIPFTITSGNSSATVTVPVTTAQTVTFEVSGLSVTPSNLMTCWDGSAANCNHTYSNAGFIFTDTQNGAVTNISRQVAGTSSGTYYLRAVKINTTTKACEATLTNPTAVNFAYECNNPSTCSPSNLMSINGGTATTIARNNNGSVTNYTSVNMPFDANGNAPFTLDFDDAGAVTLYASKAANSQLLTALTGASNSFVVAPAAFAFSGITAAPIKAGTNFSATVTALTSTGATTPNFGQESSPESATLSFTKYQPTGTGAVNGLFSGGVGAFSNGSATANNLNWSEVGTIDITATLTSNSYLGSGLSATGVTGTTGAVGRFIPDHFDTVVTEGTCTDGFTYSGQPFTVTVTAKNGLSTPTTTLNYDGSINTTPNFAKTVTLSDANAVTGGSLTSSGILASTFTAGVANATPAFNFTTKLTVPATIKLRAIDTDNASSATASEGTAAIRSGRLRLFNAFGSEKAKLSMPVQTQYWSGKSWILNNTDTCTSLPVNTFNLINASTGTGVNAAVVIANGLGTLTLTKPDPVATGSVDVAANLGASGSDQSCITPHGGTAAGLPWLRSQNGNCATTYDRDPSARATFGIYSAETKRTIHVREQF